MALIVLIIFGFATSKALKSEGNTNAGLRDQRAAFECEFLKLHRQYGSVDIMGKFRGP